MTFFWKLSFSRQEITHLHLSTSPETQHVTQQVTNPYTTALYPNTTKVKRPEVKDLKNRSLAASAQQARHKLTLSH